MCRSCDLGLPCESDGGCETPSRPANPLLAAARKDGRAFTFAAGCGVSAMPGKATGLSYGRFDPKRYRLISKPAAAGYSSDYRRRRVAGDAVGQAPSAPWLTSGMALFAAGAFVFGYLAGRR